MEVVSGWLWRVCVVGLTLQQICRVEEYALRKVYESGWSEKDGGEVGVKRGRAAFIGQPENFLGEETSRNSRKQ